jgi:hypothetical protein
MELKLEQVKVVNYEEREGDPRHQALNIYFEGISCGCRFDPGMTVDQVTARLHDLASIIKSRTKEYTKGL